MTKQPATAPATNRSQRPMLVVGAILTGVLTTASFAESSTSPHTYNDKSSYTVPDTEIRSAHPLRVYVKVGNDRGTERRGKKRQSRHLISQLSYQLPDYIHIADSRKHADLIIRVQETSYDLNFRVVDLGLKDKKYKKSRRYNKGRCGIHHKAYYTKVKEKGEAYASYSLKLVLKGIHRDRDNFTLRSAENYSYGKDLRASTNCGMRTTHHMPSSGVAKLFSRSGEEHRHYVASKIREESVRDLSHRLAKRIRQQAVYYYDDLAARINHDPSDNYGEYSDSRKHSSNEHDIYQYSEYSTWRNGGHHTRSPGLHEQPRKRRGYGY